MPLSAGTRLGPYEILAPIGKGGMGEVYRARDSKLKRDVAIKVLPEAFARDPERMARFQREAEVLASLNHPNIATIHGVEDRALVMELVEGESPKGPMPFDEAWKMASQIAAALEYAHERGIMHRDLKPANIMLTSEGVVKLLDFGLAKAFTNRGEASASMAGGSENSPTLTIGATDVGVILGTAAYMPPEQAKGKTVDKRADIWSFGVVLYELLTGDRLFKGEDVSETLAQVLTKHPDLDKIPPQARKLLRRCLEKDPKKRLRDIGEAQYLLEEPAPLKPEAATAPSHSLSGWVAWGAAALLLLAVTALGFVHFRERPPTQQSLRLQMTLPGNVPTRDIALSPDGRFLAFVSGAAGPGQLWVRSMDSLEPREVSGAEAVTYVFWSPDSANLGFFSQGKLKKAALAGGPPQTLCDVATARGGTWNRDGVILFSPGPTGPIYRVSASGGTPVAVTKLASAGEGHRFPEFLPDGNHFLFQVAAVNAERAGIYVGALNGDAPIRLLPDNSKALFAPATRRGADGHILFQRDEVLMAQPFDSGRMKTIGDIFPVAERVQIGLNNGFGVFSVSGNGLLALLSSDQAERQIVGVDRSGKRGSAIVTKGVTAFDEGTLSPDGSIWSQGIGTIAQRDIWLVDLARGVNTRFSFRSGNARNPVWSPDGSRIAYGFSRNGGYTRDIVVKSANGTGQEETLLSGGVNTWPSDWSPDGKFLLIQQTGQNTAIDLVLLPVDAPQSGTRRKLTPFAQTPFDERQGRFSPDGGWVAYVSNESGRNQVYVQTFLSTGAKYQISTIGGTVPHWRRDGKEIYYLAPDGKLMAVPIKLGSSVELGTPQVLFTDASMSNFVPAPDGQRFLVNIPASEASAAALLTVITNWQAGLKK
jgi:Tol biopolymer transport system component